MGRYIYLRGVYIYIHIYKMYISRIYLWCVHIRGRAPTLCPLCPVPFHSHSTGISVEATCPLFSPSFPASSQPAWRSPHAIKASQGMGSWGPSHPTSSRLVLAVGLSCWLLSRRPAAAGPASCSLLWGLLLGYADQGISWRGVRCLCQCHRRMLCTGKLILLVDPREPGSSWKGWYPGGTAFP